MARDFPSNKKTTNKKTKGVLAMLYSCHFYESIGQDLPFPVTQEKTKRVWCVSIAVLYSFRS